NPPTVNFPNNSHVRVQNTYGLPAAHVDMGAVESPGTTPPPPQSYVAIADNKGNVVVINPTNGDVIRRFRPFDTATTRYTRQLSVAMGDVNNDGVADVVVATRGGIAGQVKVFSGALLIDPTKVVTPNTTIMTKFPLNGYSGALTVAAADINNDGF